MPKPNQRNVGLAYDAVMRAFDAMTKGLGPDDYAEVCDRLVEELTARADAAEAELIGKEADRD